MWANTTYPHEIIIHDESDNVKIKNYITDLVNQKKISYAVLNGGRYMGVGHAMNCCLALSHGDYIFKLDCDLEYKPQWLETTTRILDEDNTVGAVGLARYHEDPIDCKKMYSHTVKSITNPFKFEIHYDIYSAGIGFRRDTYKEIGKYREYDEMFSEDINYKLLMRKFGYDFALPIKDVAVNFALDKRSLNYFDNGQIKRKSINRNPLIFAKKI